MAPYYRCAPTRHRWDTHVIQTPRTHLIVAHCTRCGESLTAPFTTVPPLIGAPMNTRQDLILGTIRTAVPTFIGWLLAYLISRIPAVASGIAGADQILAQSAPGYTVSVILNGVCIAAVVGAYYWVARKLGTRWPSVERWLLGSSKTPTYLGTTSDGAAVVTTLPDPSTSTREEWQAALDQTTQKEN